MKTTEFNPKVDAYIEKAAPFAQPVLRHLRELVHTWPVPMSVEEIKKWSMPFFTYKGQILGNMAAFKAHCSFGLWGGGIAKVMEQDGARVGEGMGSLGKVASLKDLPTDKKMLGYIRQAAAFVEEGGRTMPKRTKVTKEPEIPAELTAALKKNKTAAKVFADFGPGARREYADWVADAKRAETKEKRIATALEWIAEGKQRNWKYQNC